MPGLLTANWVQVTLVCRMVLSKCGTNLQDVGNDCHLLIWAADPRPQRPQRCRPHAHAVVNNSDVFSQSGFLWETTEATGMAEWDSVINHVEVPGALFLGVLCFKEANQSTRKLRNCIYTAGHSLGNMLWHVCRPGSNMTWCWRVHPRFFEKQPWFEDLSPEDARFWAHAAVLQTYQTWSWETMKWEEAFLKYNLGVDCSCAFVQIQTAGAALITSNLFKSVIWFFKPLAFLFCFMWKPLAGLEAGCALDGS